MSLIGDLLPAGVLNVVNGFGVKAGKPLAASNRSPRSRRRGDHHRAADHAVRDPEPHPGHAGAGRQEPEHLLLRRAGRADDYQDKAFEGFTMFALNQGEVCTCPSRSLIQADIYDEFLELAAIRTKAVRQGDPLDTETMIGAQASNDQLEKILSYIEIGKYEGAQVITGGERELRRRPQRRLLRGADDLHRRHQDADLPGGDLRSSRGGHVVPRLRRRHRPRQRHPLRAGRRGLDARRRHRLPGRARHQGRPVDQLLPRLPRARRVRRLQAVRHRA